MSDHEGWVTAVEFSPDGSRIATASEDRTARIWDSATGTLLMTLRGHEEGLNSVAFSPNGEMLITASEDKTARIWVIGPSLEALILEAKSMQATGKTYEEVYDGRLEVGNERSAIYHVSENSGDLIVFYFNTKSALGQQITSSCENDAGCEFSGDIRWLEQAPEDDVFASEHASAVGEIMSIDRVTRIK